MFEEGERQNTDRKESDINSRDNYISTEGIPSIVGNESRSKKRIKFKSYGNKNDLEPKSPEKEPFGNQARLNEEIERLNKVVKSKDLQIKQLQENCEQKSKEHKELEKLRLEPLLKKNLGASSNSNRSYSKSSGSPVIERRRGSARTPPFMNELTLMILEMKNMMRIIYIAEIENSSGNVERGLRDKLQEFSAK